jgi:bilin biosynthesis protein
MLPVSAQMVYSQGQLSEEEATLLAAELSQQLREGKAPVHDGDLIEKMVAGLGDRRGLTRLIFAESLGAVGRAAVFPLCSALSTHSNVTVRRAAAKTLTLIADPSAIPSLINALLTDIDPLVQCSAVGAIVAVGADGVAPLLEVLTNPTATSMQMGLASWGLAFVGSQAASALKIAAQSDNEKIRTAAIAALGDQIQTLEDNQARDLLVNSLSDDCAEVRAEAATLLGKLHDTDWACPLLIPKLEDENDQVRKNVALSLMKLEAKQALPNLEKCLEIENDNSVQAIFKLVINQLG